MNEPLNTRKVADMWDVVACPNDHPCFLVTSPILEIDGQVTMGSRNLSPLGDQEPIIDGDSVFSCKCNVCGSYMFRW